MKAKVGNNGVVIPREFLDGAEEVEIRKEGRLVIVAPTTKEDPILALGAEPVEYGISDASEHHDRYLYDKS